MLSLTLRPCPSDSAAPEECAAFGTLEVRANGRCLTEGVADGANDLLRGPFVSGYHIAEWLVWNWWRLRWEAPPRENSGQEWSFSHCLSSIGAGYLWPNVEISSDGVRAIISSSPTIDPAPGLYRYVGTPAFETIEAKELEDAIDRFARSVLDLLADANIVATNLHRLWNDLAHERRNPDAARLRRVEARLGHDPDEIPDSHILAAINAAQALGNDAVDELAAAPDSRGGTSALPSTQDMTKAASEFGVDARLQDAVRLHAGNDLPAATVAAWQLGVAAAQALRRQEALDGQAIANEQLCALAGTPANVLRPRPSPLSFVLETDGSARIALRSNWETGRRFDLARLLGDRLLGQSEPLLPATRSYTYRQKAQRAFAAEFLCPYDALCEFLGDERSDERCDEAARHFNISPLAVGTILHNHKERLYASTTGGSPLPPCSYAIW